MTTETRAANPPQELPQGAHDLGNGQVSFALWAPWKRSVHVIGDFNGWDKGATPLSVSDNGLWWAIVELPAGEYAYQFPHRRRVRHRRPVRAQAPVVGR